MKGRESSELESDPGFPEVVPAVRLVSDADEAQAPGSTIRYEWILNGEPVREVTTDGELVWPARGDRAVVAVARVERSALRPPAGGRWRFG